MKERIYNLYLFVEGEMISELGAVEYEMTGSEEEKIAFLESRAPLDIHKSKRFKIPDRFKLIDHDTNEITEGILRYQTYLKLCENGVSNIVFEGIFSDLNAPAEPLLVASPYVDGDIAVDTQLEIKNNNKHFRQIDLYSAPDYIAHYTRGNEFHLSQLIEDDFFSPIKLLLNNRFYISAIKLLLSAIDSFAYLEFGDKRNNFLQWIRKYMDYPKIGITPEEIWELRNAVIHMTSYDSRKVAKGEISRIIIQAGSRNSAIGNATYDGKLLDIHDFYILTAYAVEKWLGLVYSEKRFGIFFDRYDNIVSEKRSDIILFK